MPGYAADATQHVVPIGRRQPIVDDWRREGRSHVAVPTQISAVTAGHGDDLVPAVRCAGDGHVPGATRLHERRAREQRVGGPEPTGRVADAGAGIEGASGRVHVEIAAGEAAVDPDERRCIRGVSRLL